MNLKVIRAIRGIHVPMCPDNPSSLSYMPVQRGMLAIVPMGFVLPEDSYIDITTLTIDEQVTVLKKSKEKKK